MIAPIWRDLAATANLPQYRYAVRVLDSDELNAFACGGHLLVVTSFAIDELTPASCPACWPTSSATTSACTPRR